MYPPPAVGEDGWEIEPVDERILDDMFQCDNTVYVEVGGERVQLWDYYNGWDNSKNFLNGNWLEGMTRAEEVKEEQGVMSLKLLAAEAARENMGIIAVKEYEHIMDYEVREKMFKPCSWWIQWDKL